MVAYESVSLIINAEGLVRLKVDGENITPEIDFTPECVLTVYDARINQTYSWLMGVSGLMEK